MAMAYVNSILLAFLALVFVVSTAQEFPTHDHLENNPEDSQTPNDQALEVGASEKFIEPPPEDAPQDVEEQAMRRPREFLQLITTDFMQISHEFWPCLYNTIIIVIFFSQHPTFPQISSIAVLNPVYHACVLHEDVVVVMHYLIVKTCSY